ncbi:MAG TPA: DUF4190 domain-containing protein [Clostridia bacterium]|nr:DUF4190 domain-containing protein [Clostridia bacterium]
MKTCPKCGSACEDADIICRNCGYLLGNDHQASENPTPDTSAQSSGQNAQNPENQQPDLGVPPQNATNVPQNPGYPPQPGPQGGAPGYDPRYSYQDPYLAPKNDSFAIASLVLGITGVVTVFCCIGIIPCILAVIFGFISNNRIKKSGGALKGKGMAIAGLVLGFVGVGIFIKMLISLAIGGFNWEEFRRQVETQMQKSRYGS